MSPSRWSVTCALTLAITSGCSGGSGGPGAKIQLYPVLDANGRITYVTEDPYDPVAERRRQAADDPRWAEAEAKGRREEQRLQAVADSTRRNNEAMDRELQSLRQQSAERESQPRMRPRPPLQGSHDFLRNGESESTRLQQESQALDRSLEELRKTQEGFRARK